MNITLEQLNKKSDDYKKFKDQQQTKANEFLDMQITETQSYITDADNFYGALYYELWEHEYYINMDKDAVAGALGLNADEIINKYPLANEVIEFYLVEFEKLNL